MNSTCKKKCPYCKKKKKERSKRIQTKNYWHHALHKKKTNNDTCIGQHNRVQKSKYDKSFHMHNKYEINIYVKDIVL